MDHLWPHRHFKVGLELFVRAGPEAVEAWARGGAKIFLDLKLHDIPRTVAGAVAAARDLGVELLTVHGAGGLAMLQAAAEHKGPMAVVAVTLLTSLGREELAALGWGTESHPWVQRWANLAARAGLDGVVSSGEELAQVRTLWPEGRRVVPGVRWTAGPADDQRRVVTPAQAARDGATDVVVGRLVTQDPNPRAALDRLLETIGGEGPKGHGQEVRGWTG